MALVVSFALVGCKSFPVLEVCIIGDNGKMQCVDRRRPEGEQEYERWPDNDVCTNAQDYNTGLDWVRRHDRSGD